MTAAMLLGSAIFAAQVALAADPAKVLRVAFEVSSRAVSAAWASVASPKDRHGVAF